MEGITKYPALETMAADHARAKAKYDAEQMRKAKNAARANAVNAFVENWYELIGLVIMVGAFVAVWVALPT